MGIGFGSLKDFTTTPLYPTISMEKKLKTSKHRLKITQSTQLRRCMNELKKDRRDPLLHVKKKIIICKSGFS